MTNEISAAVQKRVAAEVIKHIDIESMAKRLAPKVAKEIEDAIVQNVSEIHWGDELCEMLVGNRTFKKALTTRIIAAFQR
jgi:hypothetical protein